MLISWIHYRRPNKPDLAVVVGEVCTRKVAASAILLQTISEDECDDTDELIILLTSKPKSACALKNVTEEHSIAVATVETVDHKRASYS